MNIFLPTPPEDLSTVAEFLVRIFHAGPDVNSFHPDVLDWKYFSSHPEWAGTRSYCVKHGDQQVAHGGVWPLRLADGNREIKVIHLIDWAAAKSAPGAGILLLRKLAGMADMLLTIGGSSDTRAILPKLGYQQFGTLDLYARVIRPWRQLQTTPHRNWKSPLRFARNLIWSLPSTQALHGWTAIQVSSLNGSQLAALDLPTSANILRSRRSFAALDYFLKCPAAKFSAFQIFQMDQLRGYFVLAQLAGQTRIVELRLYNEDPVSHLAGYKLATATAARNPDTCEIVAGASEDSSAAAIQQAGFRLRRRDPIFCYDPRKVLAGAVALGLNMLDGDLCFLHDPRYPHLT